MEKISILIFKNTLITKMIWSGERHTIRMQLKPNGNMKIKQTNKVGKKWPKASVTKANGDKLLALTCLYNFSFLQDPKLTSNNWQESLLNSRSFMMCLLLGPHTTVGPSYLVYWDTLSKIELSFCSAKKGHDGGIPWGVPVQGRWSTLESIP